MTSINNLSNTGYYQLSNPLAGTGTAASPDPADAILQALSSSSGSSSDNSDSDAYLLDLSPQAQALLNGTGSTSSSTGDLSSLLSGIGGSSDDSLGDLTNGGSFNLTTKQQQQITAILTKYKDAPYNQDTFNQIQNDLQSAGLGPDILSMEDQAQSFDPALVLIDALDGNTTDSSSLGLGASASDEQTKSANYMQQIISQWQTISGNTGTPAASPVTTTGAA